MLRGSATIVSLGLLSSFASGCFGPVVPPADRWPRPQHFLLAAGPSGELPKLSAGSAAPKPNSRQLSLELPGEVGTSPSTAPTFSRDVAPILYARCAVCHRPGEVGPFPLLSFSDARRRAGQILRVVESRQMPPWPPEPGIGEFQNARVLSRAELATLRAWVAAGSPEGSRRDLPPLPTFPEGWQLGTPDLVLTMPAAFVVPAEGRDVYRNFVIPVDLPTDRYVRAVEFRPGNRRVVHHATVLLDKSGRARALQEHNRDGKGPGYDGLGGGGFIPSGGLPGWVPGETPAQMPPDAAATLPAKIDVVLGMHYHPSGKPEADQSSIGIYFTDAKPIRNSNVLLMGQINIRIEPGDDRHAITACYKLPMELEITGIGPHMHLIGKSVWMWADLPDGRIVPLIWIRNWDFNWQGTYRLARPLRLPKGTKIWGEWSHDNSAANPANPSSPPRLVVNGEQSTDEMAGAWINVTLDRQEDAGPLWMETLATLLGAFLRPPFRVNPPSGP